MLRTALVVGGGIGGIPAAIAMCKSGFEVKVFEQSPELQEVGAGLTLHANALHALKHIDPDLLDAVRSHSIDINSLTIADPSGREVQRIDKQAMIDRWGYPTILVHRGELLNTLVDFARGMKNGPKIVTGTRAVDVQFNPNEDETMVVLESGSKEKAGLVIGADGLHSVIREKLHGASKPRYLGYVAWRGLTHNYPTEKVKTCASFGRGISIGLFPMTGDRVYWWLTENVPKEELMTFEKEIQGKSPREKLKHVVAVAEEKKWFMEAIDVIQKCNAEDVLHTSISDRPPMSTPWGFNCVTLIGDAAHPTSPIIGQGAGQAIEDGACLYNVLHPLPESPTKADVAEALREYETIREPATRTVTLTSYMAGGLWQNDSRLGNWLTYMSVRITPNSFALKQMDGYMKPHF